MGLIDDIKSNAIENGTKIQTSDAAKLEKIFNRMFYLDKNIDEEVKFLRQVMTRGQETQERVGLHASALIVSDKSFCIRQQVLSLLYRQIQGENIDVGLKRIFEEGNAIHEKWQRLFIRAGYTNAKGCDMTRYFGDYELTFTPDVLVNIPEFFEGKMVIEIKSVNTFQFKKMTSHPSGHKQMQFYMYLLQQELIKKGKWNGVDYTKGIVLCDDKNTQDFKVFVYDYDKSVVAPFVERCEAVQYYKKRAIEEKRMVKRCKECKTHTCKNAEKCAMKDACFNVGMGKVRI